MSTRGIVCALAAALIFFFSGEGALAQDLGDLEKVFHEGTQALDARDLDAAVARVDENVVVFSLFSPFPIKGKSGFRQAVKEYFENYEKAEFAPASPQFRILGDTGVAWGYYQLTATLKDGPPAYFHGRYLFTYARSDGKWWVTSQHYSPLQHIDMRFH